METECPIENNYIYWSQSFTVIIMDNYKCVKLSIFQNVPQRSKP